jgi:hypothetical protein
MVTDRDIVCKGLAEDNFDANRATARDVMTPGMPVLRRELFRSPKSHKSSRCTPRTHAVMWRFGSMI